MVVGVLVLLAEKVVTVVLVPAATATRAVLSQGEPRDATVNFDTYQSLQQQCTVFILIVFSNYSNLCYHDTECHTQTDGQYTVA